MSKKPHYDLKKTNTYWRGNVTNNADKVLEDVKKIETKRMQEGSHVWETRYNEFGKAYKVLTRVH